MLCFCMIVKDEASIIERCLQALKKYSYNIIVIDTGSKDNTKEIVYKYTDKVYDYKWNDSFSDARNFALKKADEEFIFMIDADEVITEFNKEKVEELIKFNTGKVGRISIVNEFKKDGVLSKSREKVSRIFSKKYYKYEGAIHEQLVNLNGVNKKGYDLPIEIIHNGYDYCEIERKDKVKRNISMLKKELAINSEDPYILYQLGKTYYMAEDYKSSYIYFNKALDIDLDVSLEYVQDLIECYGYSLVNMKEYVEALKLINVYDVFSKSSDFVFLIGLVYMNNGMFKNAVNEFIKASSMSKCKVVGVNSYLAYFNIGVIYECLGQIDEAVKYYLKCSGYLPAIDRLKLINKGC